MADLVPVRRGSRAPALRDEPRPRRQPHLQANSEVYAPLGSPFAEFDELWNRMVSGFLRPFAWADLSTDWRPAVDLEETDDAWIFEVQLPGAMREDIQVEVSETELIISGTIGERERLGVVRHRARRSGSFEYRTSLPAGVDPAKVDARLDNGLLTVRVQRPERTKTHRIKIN